MATGTIILRSQELPESSFSNLEKDLEKVGEFNVETNFGERIMNYKILKKAKKYDANIALVTSTSESSDLFYCGSAGVLYKIKNDSNLPVHILAD